MVQPTTHWTSKLWTTNIFWGEYTGDHWIPLTVKRKTFPFIESSWFPRYLCYWTSVMLYWYEDETAAILRSLSVLTNNITITRFWRATRFIFGPTPVIVGPTCHCRPERSEGRQWHGGPTITGGGTKINRVARPTIALLLLLSLLSKVTK